jgi:uncharacterized membrane protein YczE
VTRRAAQLVLSFAVLGAGVTLLLDSRLGSDGYSTLINGLHLSTGIAYAAVNVLISASFVLVAWLKGIQPGLATLLQPIVGVSVSVLTPLAPGPSSYPGRGAELVVAFALLCLGVAGYLASDLGAGPVEAAALAWDPPLPFRWSYTAVQLGGAAIGWLLGADVGVATLLVVFGTGPVVALLSQRFFHTGPAARTAARPAVCS